MSIDSFVTGSNGITFSCWFKAYESGNWVQIFEICNGQVSVNPDNANNLAVYVYFGSDICYYTWSTNCNDGNSHHVAWSLSPFGNWVLCVERLCRKLSATVCTNNGYSAAISRFWNSLGDCDWYGNACFNGHICDSTAMRYLQGLYLAKPTSQITYPSRQLTFTASPGPNYYPSSLRPTMSPSFQQSIGPTQPTVTLSKTTPSTKPSTGSTFLPTYNPSLALSLQPSIKPTVNPTGFSSSHPSSQPSLHPSSLFKHLHNQPAIYM